VSSCLRSCQQFPTAIPIKSPTKSEIAISNSMGQILPDGRAEAEKASLSPDAISVLHLLPTWHKVTHLRRAFRWRRRHSRPWATPLTYSLRRDDSDFVLFCFTKREDTEAFAKRFCGEGWRRAASGEPENNGRPSALFRKPKGACQCPMDQARVRDLIMKESLPYSATCHQKYSSLRKARCDSQTFLKSVFLAETSA
jgi:hypothetical protein